MAKLFVDASFFVALYKKDDPNHKKAQKIVSKLNVYDEFFVNFVTIGEAVTVISQRVSKSLANELLEDYRSEQYLEIVIDKFTVFSAIEIFLENRSKNFPFFDAIHAASMQKIGINKVLTFDSHFKTLGFKLI